MRMWMVPPGKMCRRHLLGEHVELHMLVGTINRGISIAGFLTKGLIEPGSMYNRHARLTIEMLRRGYDHKSPLPQLRFELTAEQLRASVDVQASLAELHRRCPDCLALSNTENA